MARRIALWASGLFCVACLNGCSSDGSDGTTPAVTGPKVLDPAQAHYGKTYSEWGAQWWKWFYELPQTAGNCVIPYDDPTGEKCTYGQTGDVWFLAGTPGGVAVRDKCVIPANKALLIPIVNFAADNGGVPPAQQLDEAGLKAIIEGQMKDVIVPDLMVVIDGASVPDLGRYRAEPTKLSYTLPPEPNMYTCAGAPGVTGLVDPSFSGGYYIMLPPFSAGKHSVRFVGHGIHAGNDFKLDVTYNLTVQ
jgi:hypothetical protein